MKLLGIHTLLLGTFAAAVIGVQTTTHAWVKVADVINSSPAPSASAVATASPASSAVPASTASPASSTGGFWTPTATDWQCPSPPQATLVGSYNPLTGWAGICTLASGEVCSGSAAPGVGFSGQCTGGSGSSSPSPSSSSPSSSSSSAPQASAPSSSAPPAPSSSPNAPSAASSAAPITGAMQFLTFWESWADTTIPLSGVPQGVTIVAVAFSTGTGGTMLLSPQNTNPIDAKTIHGQGGKIVISFGGATGTGAYSNLDANAFVTALSNFMSANPGVYDGIDFDDEADPRPPQPLIDVILATRAKFPLPFIITYDAFPSGADTGTDKTSDWQGSDLAVAPKVAGAINWVNVMDYNFGSWKPTDAKNCTVSQTASDDCRRDVLTDFAKIYPKNKILLGLEVPTADNGSEALTMADVTAYASYVKTNGYGGIMMWDLKRDTGFSYTKAIVSSLNTQGPPSQGPIVQPSPSTGGSAAASSAPGHHIGNIVITDIPKNYGATIQSAVDKYNKQYGTNLSAPFIEAIIFQESKGDPLAESQDGQDSKGLMQVSTASGFDIADLLSPGGNQYDPATSIDTGVHLLAIMDQCGSIKDPTVGNFYGTFPGACGNPLLLASKFQAGPQTTGVNTYGNQINGWMQSFQQGVQPTNGGQFPIGGKS